MINIEKKDVGIISIILLVIFIFVFGGVWAILKLDDMMTKEFEIMCYEESDPDNKFIYTDFDVGSKEIYDEAKENCKNYFLPDNNLKIYIREIEVNQT